MKEKQSTRGVVLVVSFLFLLGCAFGYFILSPMTIWFLSTYTVSAQIINQFDITSYVGTVVSMVLGCGLLFQFPIVVFFLTKVGVLTPQFMRQFRKHAIVGIVIASAIITPSSDPFTLMLVALPLYFLFEISIFVSAIEVKRMKKQEEADLLAEQQKE